MRSSGPIEDRLAIRELVECYVNAVFQRDALLWASCWMTDARWDIAGQSVGGRDQIVGLWTTLMQNFTMAGLFTTGGGVQVQGDEATGRWYMQEVLRQADGQDRVMISYYDDRYRRDSDDLWRFSHRSYVLLQDSLGEMQP